MLHDSMKDVLAQREKTNLIATIDHAEKMISIYSDRDRESMKHYEAVKSAANLKLLEIMTLENEFFLEASKGLV